MSGLGLLIRADGDSKIGFGHVMRCLALAQYWRAQQGPVTFACHSLANPSHGDCRASHSGELDYCTHWLCG